MSDRDHVCEELGGYVLGALEPAEAEAVRAHLVRCPECSREHARLAGLPALLSLAGPGEPSGPAPAVQERVLDAVARERGRPARVRRLRLPLAAALACAAVAIATLAFVLGRDGAAPAGYSVPLQSAAGAAGAGRAELESVEGGTSLRLWVRDLPPDPAIVYEVRCDAPGWSVSAGTFRADTRGRAYVVLTTAARRGEYDAIRVVRRARTSMTDVLTASLN